MVEQPTNIRELNMRSPHSKVVNNGSADGYGDNSAGKKLAPTTENHKIQLDVRKKSNKNFHTGSEIKPVLVLVWLL